MNKILKNTFRSIRTEEAWNSFRKGIEYSHKDMPFIMCIDGQYSRENLQRLIEDNVNRYVGVIIVCHSYASYYTYHVSYRSVWDEDAHRNRYDESHTVYWHVNNLTKLIDEDAAEFKKYLLLTGTLIGVTQSKLSKLLNIPVRTLQDWSTGLCTPPTDTIDTIEKQLGDRILAREHDIPAEQIPKMVLKHTDPKEITAIIEVIMAQEGERFEHCNMRPVTRQTAFINGEKFVLETYDGISGAYLRGAGGELIANNIRSSTDFFLCKPCELVEDTQ